MEGLARTGRTRRLIRRGRVIAVAMKRASVVQFGIPNESSSGATDWDGCPAPKGIVLVIGSAHARGSNSTMRPSSRLVLWSPAEPGLAGRTSPARTEPNITRTQHVMNVQFLDIMRSVQTEFIIGKSGDKDVRKAATADWWNDTQKELADRLFKELSHGYNWACENTCLGRLEQEDVEFATKRAELAGSNVGEQSRYTLREALRCRDKGLGALCWNWAHAAWCNVSS